MSRATAFGRVGIVLLVCALTRSPGGVAPSWLDKSYVVVGWNDLGMHCMNRDFSEFCILPPFNTIHAQVIRRGNPPSLVRSGVQLNYRIPTNTTSANKVNFWNYEDRLFGVSLPADIGLAGNGMSGPMVWTGSSFEATGIPLTPYEDAAPTTDQPYQFVEVTLRNMQGSLLDQTTFVAPVSVEMHCDRCHREDNMSTAYVILTKHDEEEHTNLRGSRPLLCASCHSSNALGMPGVPGVPSLSYALHHKHAEETANITCYDCHPGAQTQCLRGAMFLSGRRCEDCHGTLWNVAQTIKNGRRPWLDEPRCGTCHPARPETTGQLYRNSLGHGGLYCAACHNSPHAELPTAQSRDAVQALRVQGQATYLKDCLICHTWTPASPGPHGLVMQNAVPRRNWLSFR